MASQLTKGNDIMAEKMKKRKDGRYAKQVTIGLKDGKPVRKTIYGKTQKELDKNYRDFMSLKDKGIILQEENMTFRELSELWLTNKKVGTVREQTLNNIKRQLKAINTYIGDMKVKDLRESHIELIRGKMLSAGTIEQYNVYLIRIKAVVKYAVNKSIIAKDITNGMEPVKNENKAIKRALTREELNLIEKAKLDPLERCFVSVLLYTGLRRSEALALNVEDVDFAKGLINVSKTLIASKNVVNCLQEYTKTTSGIRKVPIPKPLIPILADYTSNKSGILFTSRKGGYIPSGGAFQYRWNKILAKLQDASKTPLANDITPHIFRHTYASDLYKAGVDIKQAQYLLGHSDIRTTLGTYTHFGYADVEIDKLEAYYVAVKMQSSDKIISFKRA